MIVLVALIFIIGGYVVYMAHKENQNADRHRNRKQTHRNTYSSNRHTSGQHGGSDQKRKSAAQNASMRMTSHRMQDVGSEAGRIRQQLKLQRVNVNTRALASAEDRIRGICRHADRIAQDINSHRNDADYLILLYREGVKVSDDAHKLRCDLRELRDALYRQGAADRSIRTLHQRVCALYNGVFGDENTLNERNRILRTYIGDNFGRREANWNASIERRAQQRRAQ